ncbi:hypothetical protein LCGC14_0320980 [marine sediment metagenome]|uniref:STAS domain-containing protein n=1 Tax=marine sediment metagenome TaxID=412755 RepID=A0A0F9W6H1_9ZZZZ|nr:anti-sigma factor antagonist [Phycisphaerae bacterium]HDZ43136.1 anti-sigma factor antagonist [Phycisphaerae bacterium]
MNVTAETYGHAVVVNIKGEITEDGLSALQEIVERNLEYPEITDVILNMAEAPSVDSVTLEYLLDLHDKLAEDLGMVKFANCDENILKILEMTRLTREFELFDDVEKAIKSAQA